MGDIDEVHPAAVNRKAAAANLKGQATRMVLRGKGILPPIGMGDNVLVPVPSFDRGRGDPSNIVAMVIAQQEDKYKVATRHGMLKTWLERNSLAATKCTVITAADIVCDEEYSLRELGTGQGYRRCSCHQSCSSKRCTCVKSGLHCNSACYTGHTSANLEKASDDA